MTEGAGPFVPGQSGLTPYIDCYFDASSLVTSGPPRAVLLCGGAGSGKTWLRRGTYASGYVLVDSADIFARMAAGRPQPFPGQLERSVWMAGWQIVLRAFAERRNIVTELIATDDKATKRLIDALIAIGYRADVTFVACDEAEAWRRVQARPASEVSAIDAGPYHRAWLLRAADRKAGRSGVPSRVETAPSRTAMADVEDCLDALNALAVGVERMRAAGDVSEAPELMRRRVREGFDDLDRRSVWAGPVAILAPDLLYCRASTLDRVDQFTRAYVTVAAQECFRQLAFRGLPVFYILDNALRDDRFQAVVALFGLAGFIVMTSRTHGGDWGAISQKISLALDAGLHVAYVEPDAQINHLDKAVALATSTSCVATFRNLDPGQPGVRLIRHV